MSDNLLSQGNKFLEFAPPGEFYSPIPDLDSAVRHSEGIFRSKVSSLPGIDTHTLEQLELLEEFESFAAEFRAQNLTFKGRYRPDNVFFGIADAYTLFAFIRHFRPNRIIEVGSGFSSAVMLDTIDQMAGYKPSLAFVDPYPERLRSLLRLDDSGNATIYEQKIETLAIEFFQQLSANDILFIDSSHVGKVGSDVLYLLLDVVPNLRQGVLVHIHDILWPFEYPPNWFREGRAWNEAYLARALVAGSNILQICFWASFLETNEPERLRKNIEAYAGHAGGSLWLVRKNN
jgi:Methyltransferase domain